MRHIRERLLGDGLALGSSVINGHTSDAVYLPRHKSKLSHDWGDKCGGA